MTTSFLRLTSGLVLAALTSYGVTIVAAQRNRISLLREVPGAVPPLDLADTAAAAIRRQRYVTIDFGALRERGQRIMLREPALTLELFPDVTVFAAFERYDPAPGGVTWVGRVEGVPMSTVTLAYGGGAMSGSIMMPNAVYQIRPAPAAARNARGTAGGALHVVAQIEQSAFPPEAPPIEVVLSEEALAAAAGSPMPDGAGVIDVLVVYTALAAAHAGGQGNIGNLVNLAVSETNSSYANSGVSQRIRLVHTEQMPYVEAGSFGSNLSALRSGQPGLDGVARLRDAHGADLVALLVHPPSPAECGIAFLMTTVSPAFGPSGFSVTDTACVPNLTFAHELGHNMGARHDWFVDGGTTPFTYAHGYVNPLSGQRWRTIMAYPDHCTALGFSCTRVLYWANPEARYLPSCDSGRFDCGQLKYWYFPGAPMGIAGGTGTACVPRNVTNTSCDADDRRALNDTAPTVANFRQAVHP